MNESLFELTVCRFIDIYKIGMPVYNYVRSGGLELHTGAPGTRVVVRARGSWDTLCTDVADQSRTCEMFLIMFWRGLCRASKLTLSLSSHRSSPRLASFGKSLKSASGAAEFRPVVETGT